MKAREVYLSRFSKPDGPWRFEKLMMERADLPAHAKKVQRDGGPRTGAYYRWLTEELDALGDR